MPKTLEALETVEPAPVEEDISTGMVITDDGYIIDPETGQVLRHVDFAPQFEVQCLADAVRVLRKRARLLKRRNDLLAAMDAEIEEIRKSYSKQFLALDGTERYWQSFDMQIEGLAAAELIDEKKKSLKIGQYTVGWRLQPRRVEFTSEVAIQWLATERPELTRPKIEVDKKELNKATDLPEELFITIEPEDKFYIDLGVK